ncbi:MAG: glycine cleavage T C-terminal barrel domain-containing protein [Pyrinomonadaceae bacterium]
MSDFPETYEKVREGGIGFYEQKRGLIAVWGKEAVQFLNGLITNDVAKLEENSQMLAAFPNAQGRLLAVVRVLRKNDRFLFETEEATREKVFQNLFRFTYAGDFFVEDLSDDYNFLTIFNYKSKISNSEFIKFQSTPDFDVFVPKDGSENFKNELRKANAVEISDELFEVLRVERGLPLYGVDMDETTIVPELDLPDLISYNKGCYIGQEIIARIHFRGHVAKKLTGLIFEDATAEIKPNDEIKSLEDKNAGKITSVTFSPKLEKTIALAFVRYDFLAEGTELKIGDFTAKVKNLPFVE